MIGQGQGVYFGVVGGWWYPREIKGNCQLKNVLFIPTQLPQFSPLLLLFLLRYNLVYMTVLC